MHLLSDAEKPLHMKIQPTAAPNLKQDFQHIFWMFLHS